jgi:hypothetical protein
VQLEVLSKLKNPTQLGLESDVITYSDRNCCGINNNNKNNSILIYLRANSTAQGPITE